MAMYVSMFPLFPLMNFTAGASLAVFTFKKKTTHLVLANSNNIYLLAWFRP
jgi:hypothetical protein